MSRDAILRKLDDLHNELAHIRMFPQHYTSYLDCLAKRLAVTRQISELLGALQIATQQAA